MPPLPGGKGRVAPACRRAQRVRGCEGARGRRPPVGSVGRAPARVPRAASREGGRASARVRPSPRERRERGERPPPAERQRQGGPEGRASGPEWGAVAFGGAGVRGLCPCSTETGGGVRPPPEERQRRRGSSRRASGGEVGRNPLLPPSGTRSVGKGCGGTGGGGSPTSGRGGPVVARPCSVLNRPTRRGRHRRRLG